MMVMDYTLHIGNHAYSSWSLRGWLLFKRFGLSAKMVEVDFNNGPVSKQMAALSPAATVPCLETPEGAIVWDSLAIAEELATRHPEAGHWPPDAAARATARSLTAEMHSGFATLRNTCPMNLRVAHTGVEITPALRADLDRLEVIFTHARKICGDSTPWLCGEYSVADAFYAPVAARVAGYGLPVGPITAAYVAAHLEDPAFRQWRAIGLVHGATLNRYAQDLPPGTWPGPKPLSAEAVETGTPENAVCPYSGKEPAYLARVDGRIFGFCNALCRDKTVVDPAAWPAFMALL
jgi:glutathione S-transferase